LNLDLTRKFIISLVSFSLTITILLSAIQAYNEFQHEKETIHKNIQLIEETSLPSLEQAIWIADDELVESQLQGILKSPFIHYVEIKSTYGKTISLGEKGLVKHVFKSVNKLAYKNLDAINELGLFTIFASEDSLYEKLSYRLLNTLILNTTLIFLVAVFFYILFSNLIVKHIASIVDYLQTYNLIAGHSKLQIEKNFPFKGSDEIDTLVNSINGLIANLKNTETQYITILDTAADGIFTMYEDGSIKDFNKAAEAIFGYQTKEVLGKNINSLLKNPAEINALSILPLKSGIYNGVHKNGNIIPLELSVSEMIINQQKMTSGIMRDITERLRIDIMKSEFVSTVSHELRTPLTSIHGSLGLIVGGAVGTISDKLKDMLDIAHSNTKRLLLLINDILDIQKIDSNMMELKIQPVDLMELINKAVVDNKAYAEKYHVKFLISHKLVDAIVDADPDRLMQVLTNLLSNAAKFSPEGETIEISLGYHYDYLRISISDHGAGIPKEFHDKIFDRFTQLDSSDHRQKGGTGLGLSIVKNIVELHKGRVSFSSDANVGTVFYVDLPKNPLATTHLSLKK